MRNIFLTCCFLLLASSVGAESYSCRDSFGQLHISDDRSLLPEECRESARVHKSEEVDTLNYVPAPEVPPGAGASFESSVDAVEQEQGRKARRAAEMQQLAEQLLDRFDEAALVKRKAKLRTSSREALKAADEQMAIALEGKEDLLKELEKAPRLSPADEAQVRQTLEKIQLPE